MEKEGGNQEGQETTLLVVPGHILRHLLEWLVTLPLTDEEKYHLMVQVLQDYQREQEEHH